MIFRVEKDDIHLISFMKNYASNPVEIKAVQMNCEFSVDTLEGVMIGKKGDYLVQGIEKELYPVKESIFKTKYRLVY